jgi:hypothetical protein
MFHEIRVKGKIELWRCWFDDGKLLKKPGCFADRGKVASSLGTYN